MKKSILFFNDISLSPSQIHKLRGYIGNLFREYDLIHNHDIETGKPIYRYPLIQFKIINKIPAILALTQRAIQVFTEMFMSLEEIVIDGRQIPLLDKDLSVETCEFGFSGETYMYEFISPWMGLNQKNFKAFASHGTQRKKNELLKRILTGNLLSMSKYLDLQLGIDQRIKTDLQFKEVKANLKGRQMIGFKGIFKTNFMIPDYAGLGKSVSRGYGVVKKIL